MSLDVSLYTKEKKTVTCYACMQDHEEQELLYDANITHNLGKMASKAGIYDALWRPYRINKNYIETKDYNKEMSFEDGIETKAKDITKIIEIGLKKLKDNPEHYKTFNSENGWGMYEHFIPFVENYLNALKEYPEAIVKVSR